MWYNMMMHTGNSKSFSQWLLDEITERRLSYVEVAKRGGISHARISQVIGGEPPGKRFCRGIAKAFDLPVEDIFRRAGILPPIPDLDANAEAMLHLFRNLPESEQDRVLTIMRALSTMHATAADDANGSNDTTKGE